MLSDGISQPQKIKKMTFNSIQAVKYTYAGPLLCPILPHYSPFPSQWLGSPPPGLLAQLMTVRLVVYAMATKPKMQRRMSDHRRRADLATAL